MSASTSGCGRIDTVNTLDTTPPICSDHLLGDPPAQRRELGGCYEDVRAAESRVGLAGNRRSALVVGESAPAVTSEHGGRLGASVSAPDGHPAGEHWPPKARYASPSPRFGATPTVEPVLDNA